MDTERFSRGSSGVEYSPIFVLMNVIKLSQKEQPFTFELRTLFAVALIVVFTMECIQCIRDGKFSGWVLWDALIVIIGVTSLALGFW